ncbi:MAG: hypothetical protein ACE5LB_04575 [Acidiferrobacterales bacterium]
MSETDGIARQMLISALAAIALSAACSESGNGDKPYIEFIGGGFIFNYRLAEADYGFVVKPLRRIPTGTILEAEFENPSGGEPIVVRQTAKWGRAQYTFRTPPVRGVKANRDYRVELRLLDPEDGHLIAAYAETFRSDVDQSILPERPTVIGPGHQPAPPQGG